MSHKATDRVTTIVIAMGSDATDRSMFNVRNGSPRQGQAHGVTNVRFGSRLCKNVRE